MLEPSYYQTLLSLRCVTVYECLCSNWQHYWREEGRQQHTQNHTHIYTDTARHRMEHRPGSEAGSTQNGSQTRFWSMFNTEWNTDIQENRTSFLVCLSDLGFDTYYDSASQTWSSSIPNITHLIVTLDNHTWFNLWTNHQALNELNEVCLPRAPTKLCTVRGIRGPGLGNTVLWHQFQDKQDLWRCCCVVINTSKED